MASTMSRRRNVPRQLQPELEHAYSRSPSLGYEPPEAGFIRCLSTAFRRRWRAGTTTTSTSST
jgi:hypothetical protein